MFAEFSVGLGAEQARQEQGVREEFLFVYLRGFCLVGPCVGLKFSPFP